MDFNNFFNNLGVSNTCLLMFILIISVITFIVSLTVLILLFGLRNNDLFIINTFRDLKSDINNVITGSKRVEKMCDAINQRTKAHLVPSKKPNNNSNKKTATATHKKNTSDKKYNKGRSNDKNQKHNSDNSFTVCSK